MATGCELEKVETVHRARLYAGDVAEATDEVLAVHLRVVNDQRTAALAVAATTELALTGARSLRLLDFLDLGTSANCLQEAQSGRCLGERSTRERLGVDNQGNFGHGGNLVTAGQEERSNSRGRQSGGRGKAPGSVSVEGCQACASDSLLVLVDLDVPLAPDLGRSEHATGAAHVTECSLTSTVRTAARDTGDTGNSTTWSTSLSACRPRSRQMFSVLGPGLPSFGP